MYFSQTSKKNDFDSFFTGKDFFQEKKLEGTAAAERTSRKLDYYSKKDAFCDSGGDVSKRSGGGGSNSNGSGDFGKRSALFTYGKKLEELSDSRKNQMSYFNGNKKLAQETAIHLNGSDGFGKKSISFTAEQVLNHFFLCSTRSFVRFSYFFVLFCKECYRVLLRSTFKIHTKLSYRQMFKYDIDMFQILKVPSRIIVYE